MSKSPIVFTNGPNAHPVNVTHNTLSGAQLVVIGGLTKREHIAAFVAAGKNYEDELASAVADRAVAIADAILALTETKEKDDYHRDEAPE